MNYYEYSILGELSIFHNNYVVGDPMYDINDDKNNLLFIADMKKGKWKIMKIVTNDEIIYNIYHIDTLKTLKMDNLNQINLNLPLCSGNIGIYHINKFLDNHYSFGTLEEYKIFKKDFTLLNPFGDLPVDLTIFKNNNNTVAISVYI